MRNKPGSGRGSKWQRAGAECSRVLHTRLPGVACARLDGPWVKMPSRMHWRLRTQKGQFTPIKQKVVGLPATCSKDWVKIHLWIRNHLGEIFWYQMQQNNL